MCVSHLFTWLGNYFRTLCMILPPTPASPRTHVRTYTCAHVWEYAHMHTHMRMYITLAGRMSKSVLCMTAKWSLLPLLNATYSFIWRWNCRTLRMLDSTGSEKGDKNSRLSHCVQSAAKIHTLIIFSFYSEIHQFFFLFKFTVLYLISNKFH